MYMRGVGAELYHVQSDLKILLRSTTHNTPDNKSCSDA